MSESKFDFVAIGDVTTDAFISLKTAEVVKHKKDDQQEICMPWGAKIEYEGVTVVPAVGNCANAAVSAARLGLTSALLSHVGDDQFGKEQLETLEKQGVSIDLMTTHPGKPSNYHYVLSYKSERTILVKHEPWPYVMSDIGSPKWIYVTSLGETSLEFHGMIMEYLDSHPDIKLAFQPGTFQMKLGKDKLSTMYKHANVFFCNVQEAQLILGTDDGDVKNLMKLMHDLGPKIVCITDGPNGAYAYDSASGKMWFMPIYPDPKEPLDRTGAGDAFSSTFAIAIAKGKGVKEALRWGPINSMSVVQYFGAVEGLLSEEQIEKYIAEAPADYLPRRID